ncbi:hypothetical protein ACFFV8_21570 [Sphingobium indicum]|uniref:hypothetical protein n=2 Tax=Sphingomonadaceae TaxID=41297 RepID=UPI0035E70929
MKIWRAGPPQDWPGRGLIWVIPFAVARNGRGPHSDGMDANTTTLIMTILSRAPQWIRHDLLSKDAGVKQRAEETLAAMIANALATGTDESTAS